MALKCWVCEKGITQKLGRWITPSWNGAGDPQGPVLVHSDCRGSNVTPENKVLVPHEQDMDYLIFKKHLELRHAESLGGQTKLRPDYNDEHYALFHNRLHAVRLDLDHDHKPASSEESEAS